MDVRQPLSTWVWSAARSVVCAVTVASTAIMTSADLALADSASIPADVAATPPSAGDTFKRAHEAFSAAREFQENHPSQGGETRSKYRAAGDLFAACWDQGVTSTQVATNAANSYAFADEAGKAVLFYRRALAVDPSNERARGSLDHLRLTMPITRQVSASDSLVETLFFWHYGLTFSLRLSIFTVIFPLAFALLAVAQWRRRFFFAAGIALLVVALVLAGSIGVDAAKPPLAEDGVIQVEIEGKRGDGETYSASHSRPFPPGTEVSSVAGGTEQGSADWVHVRLLDGTTSWIPARAVDWVIPRRLR